MCFLPKNIEKNVFFLYILVTNTLWNANCYGIRLVCQFLNALYWECNNGFKNARKSKKKKHNFACLHVLIIHRVVNMKMIYFYML